MVQKSNDETPLLQLKKTELELWIARINLLIVIVGFLSTGGLLYSQMAKINKQGSEIANLKDTLRDIHSLRAALTMPLEGIWNYRVDYNKYFNEPMQPGKDGSKYLKGEAHVLWNPPMSDTFKYTVYIGAALYETNKAPNPIVTAFSKNTILTDSSGIPKDGFSMNGEYIARTSSDPKYANPTQETFMYKNGKIERGPTGQIQSITFDFDSGKSKGTIKFLRQ